MTARARRSPGLIGEAPATRGYYALALERLQGAGRVLDAGCGGGLGAKVLRDAGLEVVAVDRDAAALDAARTVAPGSVCVNARLEALPQMGALDAAVAIDVLGQVESPLRALLGVRARLESEAARVFVAEPRAYPTQSLRAPARRAFSPRALTALVEATGFVVEETLSGASPFVALVARVGADPSWRTLADAIRAADAGDLGALQKALDRARQAPIAAARVEACLTAGDLHLARGEGDASARAYFAAREADAKDPRPAAALARLAFTAGDLETARSLAISARALDPTDARSAHILAAAYDARRERHDMWLIASALAPDDAEIASACAEYALLHSQHGAGAFVIERLRRYDAPVPPRALDTLARLLDAMGRPADASLERRLAEAARATLAHPL